MTPRGEPFASDALKLGVLLDVERGAPVLLAGPRFVPQGPAFAAAGWRVETQAGGPLPAVDARAVPCALVCLDLRNRWGDASPEALLAWALARRAPGGSLVVATEHPWSLDHLVALLKLRPRDTGGAAPATIRAAAARAGLTARDHLALPDFDELDEYVDAGSPSIELPSYANLLHRAANRAGIYPALHRSHLLVLDEAGSSGMRRLVRTIEHALPTLRGGETEPLRLARFALRSRGALLLILERGVEGFVARGGVTPGIAAHLARNRACSERLHALPEFAERFGALVPRIVAQVEHAGVDFTIEERKTGTLAWKLPPHGAAAERAQGDAIRFIDALGSATARGRRIDGAAFASLIGADADAVARAFSRVASGRPALSDVERLRTALRARLEGRDAITVLGHGDYGFGNLLCDPATGALTGVIDWDTHVEEEFAGVDRANLVLQRAVGIEGGEVGRAYAKVQAGAADPERDVLPIAALRILRRSAHYPEEFARAASAHAALLRAALEGLGVE